MGGNVSNIEGSEGASSSVRASRATRFPWLKTSTAILGLMLTSPAFAGAALPTGGQYVAGSGKIGQISHGLVVNQSSQNGIINWQGFSIGTGNSVVFNNGSGATLNRVTGGNLSQIEGSLSATGSVYLINPQGVVIGPGGQVITNGSFVASTRDISNSQFMQGGALDFQGTSSGNVVNSGSISSANGDVVLIGNAVTNSGTISAPNGTAGLAAGNQILLQQSGGDQHVFVSGGTGNVRNIGTVSAAAAELKAAGGNVYALAGNNGGIVRATGGANISGDVWLTAGGTTEISGTVSATNANGSGGTVVATGNSVSLTSTANVSASGTRGGTVLIGGDAHGGSNASAKLVADTVQNAGNTTVAKGARISADGTAGAGGAIVVWSDELTDYEGAISAVGTGLGNGGSAEVSSHDVLGFTGTIDLTAANGQTGTLLLDPENVTISSSASGPGLVFNGSTGTPDADNSVITPAFLESALSNADITIATGSTGSQSGNITVSSGLTWASAHTLTLTAANNIEIEAAISITGTTSASGLILTTGGSGALNFYNGGNVTFAGTADTLKINGASYTLVNSMSGIAGMNLNGNYALANSITSTTTYTKPVVGAGDGSTTFNGTFEGLGNTISGLAVHDTTNGDWDGLFGYVSSTGTVRDLNLTNKSIVNTSSGNGVVVGGLAGEIDGTAINNSTSGTITSGFGDTGGLVGQLYIGTISQSHSSATVTATGNGDNANYGYVGGLVGQNIGTITQSYASGNVSGTNVAAGGLVGGNLGNDGGGYITQSYATGSVTVSGTGTGYFGLYSNAAGGLVGINIYNDGAPELGVITNSYATGNVSGGVTTAAGGLVGLNTDFDEGDTVPTGKNVTTSYSTGAVSAGSGSKIGGTFGENDENEGSGADVYFNSTVNSTLPASGLTELVSGDTGGTAASSGASGLSTSAFQSGTLPSGFSTAVWGTPVSGYNPYLSAQFPTGAIAISGIVSASNNTALPQSGVTVDLLADGSSDGSTTSNASGTYAFLVAAGLDYLAYVPGGVPYVGQHYAANTYIQAPTSSVTDANIYAGYLNIITSAANLSSVATGISNALGSNGGANFVFTVPGGVLTLNGSTEGIDIAASGAFTIDQPIAPKTASSFSRIRYP